VLPNLTVEATSPSGAVVNYGPPSATDLVSGVTFAYSQASGTTFAMGTTTVTVTASDASGNKSTQTFTVLVRDTTPPVVKITGVTNGGVYTLGGAPAAGFTATDNGSGIQTSSGTLTGPGTPSGAGVYLYTVTATDKAGNTAQAVAVYYVLYNFGGFMKPLAQGVSYALGTKIPVKFQLTDSHNNLITNAVAKLKIDNASPADGGSFVWDSTNKIYIYTLNTAGMTAGDHLMQVTLDDGTVHQLMINLSGGGVNVENGTLYDSSSTVQDGQSLTVYGFGYQAGTTVTVDFGSAVVGTAVANSWGIFAATITIPLTAAPGTYVIEAIGTSADGALRVDSTIVTVLAP
jgi:hypothetical protein